MSCRRCSEWKSLIALVVWSAGAVCAQDFPNKPIRITTSNPGGSADFLSRAIAEGAPAVLGQPVVVTYGGNVVNSTELASKAPPDGYTMLVTGNTLWIGPLLQKMPYDPVKDFAPVSLATSAPLIVVVHPSLPVKSVKELIALAKSRPGELNYATAGAGGAPHLAAELFKSMAGVNIVRIPYKGSSLVLTSLLGGEVQVTFLSTGTGTGVIKTGKLRALAVTSAKPSALAPGLPTVAASGVPGFESVAMYGAFAPARTPTTIVERLHREIVRALERPEMKEKLLDSGQELVGYSPRDSAAYIKTDMAKMGRVIKDVGITGD